MVSSGSKVTEKSSNQEDKFLRDSIVLSVFTRNIGN